MRLLIVQTDNFDGDYPAESFVTGIPVFYDMKSAQAVADAINNTQPEAAPRYWKVVEEGYVLQPGFEP